jgi:hypothetical protein
MKPDKNLEQLLGLRKLLGEPIKDEGYTSPLENDTMKVKGGLPPVKEPVTKIKNATDKIDTKQVMKLTPGADFNSKIARLRAMKNLGKIIPGLGAVTALGSGMMSDNASASDTMNSVMEELPGDLPFVGQAYDAIRAEPAGPQLGSLDDRLQKGQLSPEEMEMLRKQYLGSN